MARSGTKTTTVNLPTKDFEKLRELAEKDNLTQGQVLSKGLRVWDFIRGHSKAGNEFIIREKGTGREFEVKFDL